MRLYAPNSTQLATNGIGEILCESAIVHEEINGEFSLKFKVAQESPYLEDVVIGAIVKTDTPRGKQFFRCSKPVTTLDGGKEVFAWHITQDLAQDIILNRAWTGKTGSEALPEILQAGISERRFTGMSDISFINNMRIVRTNVLKAIIGDQDNSFVNRWGGEIERDNFTVNVKSRLGADKGVTIIYRKNLTGLTLEEDDNEIANRIIPTGLDEDDSVIMLPEVYIDSDNIEDTPIPHVRHVHFSDVKVGKKDEDGNVLYSNEAAVITELRARVAEMYAQGVDLPLKSAKVEFIDLSQTEEYKNFVQLETVEIGDTIKCIYRGITITQRVVSYDYDSLTKKYINIVLGNLIRTNADSQWAQDLDLSALRDDVATTVKQGEVYNGIRFNHEEGGVVSAVISGKTITLKMNGQTGFAVYDGSTYVGGVKVVNGKVLFIGNAVETSAVIGGKTITVKQDPTEGLAIYDGTTFKGGVKVIDGNVVVVTNWLTNNIDGDCYAVIGDIIVDSVTYKGVLVYNKSVSTSVPVLKIATGSVTSGGSIIGGIVRLITYNGASLWLSASAGLAFRLFDASGVIRVGVDNLNSRLYSPNGNNAVGVNDTGVFKKIGENTTYL